MKKLKQTQFPQFHQFLTGYFFYKIERLLFVGQMFS